MRRNKIIVRSSFRRNPLRGDFRQFRGIFVNKKWNVPFPRATTDALRLKAGLERPPKRGKTADAAATRKLIALHLCGHELRPMRIRFRAHFDAPRFVRTTARRKRLAYSTCLKIDRPTPLLHLPIIFLFVLFFSCNFSLYFCTRLLLRKYTLMNILIKRGKRSRNWTRATRKLSRRGELFHDRVRGKRKKESKNLWIRVDSRRCRSDDGISIGNENRESLSAGCTEVCEALLAI